MRPWCIFIFFALGNALSSWNLPLPRIAAHAATAPSVTSAEELVVRRLKKLTKEVEVLQTDNQGIAKVVNAGDEEVRRRQTNEVASLAQNTRLVTAVQHLETDNHKLRTKMATNWDDTAHRAQHELQLEAQFEEGADTFQEARKNMNEKEKEIQQNRSALENEIKTENEHEAGMKRDLSIFKEANARFKGRKALLSQIRTSEETNQKLSFAVWSLKQENHTILHEEQHESEQVTLLRDTLADERQKGYQAAKFARRGPEELSSLEVDLRQQKARLLSKTVAAEEELATQNKLVLSLQVQNDKLQAEVDAGTLANSKLSENTRRTMVVVESKAEKRAAAAADFQALGSELRSQLKAEGSKPDEDTDDMLTEQD